MRASSSNIRNTLLSRHPHLVGSTPSSSLACCRSLLPLSLPSSLSSYQPHRSFHENVRTGNQLAGLKPPIGRPFCFAVTYDNPYWRPAWEKEDRVMPRDAFGVPAHIPPEISTQIKHVYSVPPQYYPFLKKLGDDTPWLKPYVDKLMAEEMTFPDFEEMFYRAAKPLKIYRSQIPKPYRTIDEQKKSDEVQWENSWMSYRQKIACDYYSTYFFREYILAMWVSLYFSYLWVDAHRQYRLDMKLFYLEAPENKRNWLVPRGDLI